MMDVAKIMSVHEHIIALSNICNLEFLLLSIPNYNWEFRITIGTIRKFVLLARFRYMFLRIYALFGVFFTSLNNMVMYQNGQI